MIRNAQQIRSRLLTVILAGVAGVGFATAATAAGVGVDVDANVGANVSAGAQVAAPLQAGGAADAHMSTAGSTNSNAQWQSGATRGADRAAERMGTSGAELTPSTELEAAGKTNAKAKRSVTR